MRHAVLTDFQKQCRMRDLVRHPSAMPAAEGGLGNQLANEVAPDIGQAELPALVSIGQLRMVNSQLVQ